MLTALAGAVPSLSGPAFGQVDLSKMVDAFERAGGKHAGIDRFAFACVEMEAAPLRISISPGVRAMSPPNWGETDPLYFQFLGNALAFQRQPILEEEFMEAPFDAYVGYNGKDGVPIEREDGKKSELLWGDGVFFVDDTVNSGKRRVRARGMTGWVATKHLSGRPLLELYFIDVGQGDGVLIRTPDFRHILIDAGFPRKRQPTNKSGADFVDWKFHKDYSRNDKRDKAIRLDTLIASHNDYDHYGGLIDLLDVEQQTDLDCIGVTIENFSHAGLSWWKGTGGKRTLGDESQDNEGGTSYAQLLEDRDSALAALDGSGGRQLQGTWSDFIQKITESVTADGSPTSFTRLSHLTGTLPGFEDGEVKIEVLGPVERDCDGRPGLRKLGAETSGKTNNGQSVLLLLSFRKSRLLVTGDLNTASQKDLLEKHGAAAFACDVAKACHHGSDDVSLRFLQAMEAGATVISSGDSEGHDHPRPRIVAASGLTGHQEVSADGEQLITPLVYSTEIARSHKLGLIETLELEGHVHAGEDLKAANITYKEHSPGSINPKQGSCDLHKAYVLSGLVYGLVNVRTDGERIMCATLNEEDQSWSIREFQSRF